ncbi:MAG: PAS domain S-box protein [Mariprofundaceae bacterium]|nr:PAS domain S-box protein [Mariprofundaceae bacterium]
MSNELNAAWLKIYVSIIEASPDAIFLADAETGLIVEGNEQASGLIGRPRKEIIGMHQSDLHPKEEAGYYQNIFRQNIQKGTAIEGSVVVLHRDGHHVPVEVTAGTIEIDGRKFIQGIFRDISERRRLEEGLRALSARYEALLAAIPEIVMEVDSSRIYRWANRAGIEFFGEDVIGREAGFYFEGEQETYTAVQPLFDGDENPIYLESWQHRSDGQRRLLAWNCKALRGVDGAVTGALSTARDITESRRAEEEVARNEERYRTLFQSVADYAMVLKIEESGPPVIVDANDAAFEKHGYRREEMIDQPITLLDTTSSAEKIGERLELIKKGELVHFEAEHRCKDGSTFFTEIAARAIEYHGEQCAFVVEHDISSRKQVEKEIEQAKHELEQFFSVVPSLICIAGTDGYFKEINHEWETVLGYSKEELLSKPFTDLIHPDDLEMTYKEVEKQLSGQSTTAFVNRYRHKDGGYRWLEWRASPALENNLYAAANDITDRVHAERQLQQRLEEAEKSRQSMLYMLEDLNLSRHAIEAAKKDWESTFDAVTDPIFLHDSELRILRANRAYAEQAGMEIGEVVGKLYWEVFPKGDGPLPGCAKMLEKAAAEEIMLEDGRIFLNKGYTMCVEGEEPLSIHVMEDVTEHREAELKLSESNETVHAMATSAFDALLMMDHEGRITFWNSSAERLFGYPASEAVGKELHPLIAPARFHEAFYSGFKTFIRTGKGPVIGQTVELTGLKKDGTEFPIELSLSSVNLHGEWHAVGTIRDVTDRKQAEQNLEHVNRALIALSTVNHELVHAESETDLLQAICRAIVEQHGYRMAWVGYAQDDKNRSIKIMASAGIEKKLLNKMQPGWAKNKAGMGPSGRAIRSGETQVTQDIAVDSNYQQWGGALLKSDCAADIALPLMDADNKAFGLLHVYAERVNAFTDREIKLLQETADDLAFGVRSLRLRLHRDEIMAVNEQQLVQIHRNLQETIAAVARAVEARDPYTAGHQRRVVELATAIARAMSLEESRIEGIRMGAIIHDIGKIHLPAEILSKPSRLTDIEYSLIRSHPQAGFDILKDIHFPWPVADIAHQHHERLDGSGYPQGLKGDQICLEARIVAVADVVEAMSSHRPYRASLGIKPALEEIETNSGGLYDADVVAACLTLFEKKAFSFESEETPSTA